MSQRAVGQLSILFSVFFLYAATVVIEVSQPEHQIPTSIFVLGRFSVGFVCCLIFILTTKQIPKIHDLSSLILRAFTNCLSVYYFYETIRIAGAGVGNAMNMTYPVFLGLFALLTSGLQGARSLLASLIAFVGVLAILKPGDGIMQGGWTGVIAGITATLSVASLEETRKYNDTTTVLLFLYTVGSCAMTVLYWNDLKNVSVDGLYVVLASSVLSVIGQMFFTFGAKYISSVENGVISSLRILVAMFFAPLIHISTTIGTLDLVGAALLFTANVLIFTDKKTKKSKM